MPFFFYGLAFLLVGVSALVTQHTAKGWVQNLAMGSYAIASSSGSLFFALNFGDQGGVPVTTWVFRACVIQGTEQLYIVALFWWATVLAEKTSAGTMATTLLFAQPVVATTTGTLVALLMWLIGGSLYFGLPPYYHQEPGKIPSFLTSILRRPVVMWFFATVLLQNFFLSGPYGRNWMYLFSATAVPTWAMALLALLFFAGVWAATLWGFSYLSKEHSWVLPLVAIGLGAPRWAQMLWSTSGIGNYLPWTGTAQASAIVGRTLWLWLGVMDSLQGVGFGMILLHTLTRFHIAFTLISAQVIGSIATIAARGFAPDSTGPGPVFPNLAVDPRRGLSNAWFWVALLCQLGICVAAFGFFRKGQLSKP